MGFFYKFTIGLLMIFMLSISVAHAFVPPGFETVNSKPGWTIWKKSQNGGDVYVQKIDLNQRSIQFINNTKQNGSYPLFAVKDKYASMSILSLSNGTFFDKGGDGTIGMSYPYKSGSVMEDGYSTSSHWKNRELRVFVYSPLSKTASVVKYSSQSFNGDYVTGVTPYHDQNGKMYKKIGRTFIGIQGNKTVYLLNAEKLTQDEARLNLVNFLIHESDIVMLDGAASTQLSFKNSSNSIINVEGCLDEKIGTCIITALTPYRKIPQAIAVY